MTFKKGKMTEVFLMDLGKKAFFVTLLLAGPLLGFGMIVGLLIAILQAVTQIQEMTLTFVPKILAVAIAAAIFGPWMLVVIIRFTHELFIHLPTFVK